MSDVLSKEEIDNLVKALNEETVNEDFNKDFNRHNKFMNLKKDPKLIMAYVSGWNDAIDKVRKMDLFAI